MLTPNNITFITAVNSQKLFEANLMASPALRAAHYPVLAQRDFASAPRAYNNAIGRVAGGLMVFLHQDVILPAPWVCQLQEALHRLNATDPNWGVLGCAGVTRLGQFRGAVYMSGEGLLRDISDTPQPVQTLDEIVLIVRKSAGLRFDRELPHFHLYGADICLRAAHRGMNCYAISAPCIHNTRQPLVLPDEFYECCDHIRRRWKRALPVETTCIRLTRSNLPVYMRKLRELRFRLGGMRESSGKRIADLDKALSEIAAQ